MFAQKDPRLPGEKESLSKAEKGSKVNARKFGGSLEIESTRNHDHLLRLCSGLEKN